MTSKIFLVIAVAGALMTLYSCTTTAMSVKVNNWNFGIFGSSSVSVVEIRNSRQSVNIKVNRGAAAKFPQVDRGTVAKLLEQIQVTKNTSWDFLIFTQTWAPSICAAGNSFEPDSCSIPVRSQGWTIHGLWPADVHSMGPSYCKSFPEWHFNASKIEDLEEKMERQWPNMIKGAGTKSLWKHEWEKHGSCAVIDSLLKDEHHYFAHGLSLNEDIDLSSILKQAGIIPGEVVATGEQFKSAVEKSIGKNMLIHCVKDKNDQWYVSDLRVCINKTLDLIDCPRREGSPVRYTPTGFNYYNLFDGLPQETPCPDGVKLMYPDRNRRQDLVWYKSWMQCATFVTKIVRVTLYWCNFLQVLFCLLMLRAYSWRDDRASRDALRDATYGCVLSIILAVVIWFRPSGRISFSCYHNELFFCFVYIAMCLLMTALCLVQWKMYPAPPPSTAQAQPLVAVEAVSSKHKLNKQGA